MAREIKFRGKRFDDDRWVYGDLLHVGNGCIIVTDSTLGGPLPDGDTALSYGIDEIAVVNSDTIGQFTGITDKNGTEIYEGDVLRFYDEESVLQVVVKWENRGFRFVYLDEQWVDCSWPAEDMEIIGNIYDNPELLKAETL